MDMLRVVLFLFKFGFAYADNYGVLYRIYQGSSSLHASRLPLVRCAIGNLGQQAFGISFNPLNGNCASLNREWLTDKPTDKGLIYMETIGNSQEFVPPKFLYYNSTTGEENRFDQSPLVEIQNGSWIHVYFMSSYAKTGFHIALQNGSDYLLRALVRYHTSLLSLVTKFDDKVSTEVGERLHWTVNKTEKISFRTVGASFEIYHDDQWITTINDSSSPYFSFDINLVSVWSAKNPGYFNLHRIVYTQ